MIDRDPAGFVHKGYSIIHRSFLQGSRWGNRRVQWLADSVNGPIAVPEVWAHNEILRPKLEAGDA